MSLRVRLLTTSALFVLLSCERAPSIADASDVATDTNETDAAITETGGACMQDFRFESGSADGHAIPLASSATEARAGRVRDGMLPTDPTGLAVWRVGDYVLANNRIAVVIEGVRPSHLYDPWGGKLAGISLVNGGRMVRPADFNEAVMGIGRHVVRTESVSVLRDGSTGGKAVIRAAGPLAPLPFIDEFAEGLLPGNFTDLRAAIDYELEPNADHVDVYLTFQSKRSFSVHIPVVMHAFFQRDRMPLWYPRQGFSAEMGTSSYPYIAFIGEDSASYAWMAPGSILSPLLSESGFDAFSAEAILVRPCAETRLHFGRLVVGGPSLDGLGVAVARINNQQQREIRGTVSDGSTMPAAGVHVHATSLDGNTHLSRVTTDAMGAYALHVPQGMPVRLTAYRQGDAIVTRDVDATTAMAPLQFAPTGSIRIVATERGMTRALPVKVQILPVGAARPSLPARYGEISTGERLYIDWPHTGTGTYRAPPGTYRVVVSHGPEFDVLDREVTVTAGATIDVPAELGRVVSSEGVLCGDFHVHTHRSPDAGDSARLKLAALAGEDVQLAVRTDHEYVADFQALVEEMNLQAFERSIGGIEFTTFTYGHFNVFPLNPDPARVNGGAFNWSRRLPPDVFADVRREATQPTIIINHPRGTPRGAYFSAAQLDRATGVGRRAGYWDTAFTVVEFFNDSSFNDNREETVRDWFSFLDHGRRVFAVGSSDSHTVLPNSPVGYPRTCAFVGTDDPAMVTPNTVRDAVARGRSVISGGIFVNAVGPNNTGVGQEATGVGPMATIRVTVQAPSWVRVQRLEVIVNGRTTETIPIEPSAADPRNPAMRWQGNVNVPVGDGTTYVLFHASGDGDLAPIYPGRKPFGVTNPIFLRRGM